MEGVWGEWGAWGECSTSCGLGYRIRSRRCSPPLEGGAPCEGETTGVEVCTGQPCLGELSSLTSLTPLPSPSGRGVGGVGGLEQVHQDLWRALPCWGVQDQAEDLHPTPAWREGV